MAAEPRSPSTPAVSLKAVTPHASNDLPDGISKALFVGTSGNVEVLAEGDTVAVVLKNVPSGTTLPIRVKAVRVASTTATDIVALY